MTVPIAVSPGRSGFGPQLTLSYDSGAGNGPFGFGWTLGLPAITRKTDKGLPLYRDEEESDVFILSGSEDLVPVLRRDVHGGWERHEHPAEIGTESFTVRRYRPRIEGLFARIERWTRDDGDVHWRSITKDNVTTLYGRNAESRICDPADRRRVFSWLICQSYDARGNVAVYEYKAEDPDRLDTTPAHEANRSRAARAAQRYVKRVKYGGATPYYPEDPAAELPAHWLFEAVFDYDDGHYEALDPDELGREQARAVSDEPAGAPWPQRQDPFSTYRPTFELRTYRLCRRVLMFHHFPPGANGEQPYDGLVRATEFSYDETPIASFLTRVTQAGFRLLTDDVHRRKALPPVDFEYSRAEVDPTVREADAAALENLPAGLGAGQLHWLDLDGEGIPGVLALEPGGWFYKKNLSPMADPAELRLGALERLALEPTDDTGGRFMDLEGDGQLDFVQTMSPLAGFYERTNDASWQPYRAFGSQAVLDWSSPDLRVLDLTGDGQADLLLGEEDCIRWYPSLGEDGFGPAEHAFGGLDERRGPRLVTGDAAESVFVADMSGDGLADLVRVRNGDISYWPNLGYGRFGAKVTMDGAPRFDAPDRFDAAHVHLADVDGSGATDVIYAGADGVLIYRNQSGNAWGDAEPLAVFPDVTDPAALQVTDLFATGTACLVWSSGQLGDARRPLRYVDLMGGQKPHLLVKVENNLGAETHVTYAPSTRFYLGDKLAGRPWVTRIPFPVHVVERVETLDRISRNRFVTRYAYHHGHFDGHEREFRGFGMVEQWDTEEIETLAQGPAAANLDQASHVPPVLTRTWFHTGAYLRGDEISRHLAQDYHGAPPADAADFAARFERFLAGLLPDTVLPDEPLTAGETEEACRSLRGALLRQEVYARDRSPGEDHPYSVSERNYTIRLLQPRDQNEHAVFFPHGRETIAYHLERDPDDPRVGHDVVLAVDAYGNVERSAAIAYPRAAVPGREPEQAQTHITVTLNRVANVDRIQGADRGDWYRAGVPVETRTYEIAYPPDGTSLMAFGELESLVTALVPANQDAPSAPMTIPSERWDWRTGWDPAVLPGGMPNSRLRLVEHLRTRYRADDLTGLLPLAQVGRRGLPGETYRLALTAGMITALYAGAVDDTMLGKAGYVNSEGDGDWWIPSGRVGYHPAANASAATELAAARASFFQPSRYRDPFGTDTRITYDSHGLMLLGAEDAVGNEVTAGERVPGRVVEPRLDYRVLRPSMITDPNRNRTQVVFDALGMVAGTAVMGKAGENVGDLVDTTFDADLDEATVARHMAAPLGHELEILGKASSRIVYDLDAYRRSKLLPELQPAAVSTLSRETHHFDAPGGVTRVQVGFGYSDGFGREVQRKTRAEPGPVTSGGPVVDPRWVGTGWTVYNNKGSPVRKYEPFFTGSLRFEFAAARGVSPVLFYDPLQRVVATVHPDDSWGKAAFSPWALSTWDANDTTTLDPAADAQVADFFARHFRSAGFTSWYAARRLGQLGVPEQEAASKASVHGDTPTTASLDSLGRAFLTIARNVFDRDGARIDESHPTRVELDIEGNIRVIRDAIPDAADPAGRRVLMRYDYDLAGRRVRQNSVDSGRRLALPDVAGKPAHAWDGLGRHRWTEYDAARRPARSYFEGGPENPPGPVLFEQTVYGEANATPEQLNLRGRLWQQFDGAGRAVNDEYDFKGNAILSSRRLASGYRDTPDWAADPMGKLDAEEFTSRSWFDALNRTIQVVPPHSSRTTMSVLRPIYNEAGLLDAQHVWLQRTAEPGEHELLDPATSTRQPIVNIDYNARGQRESIAFRNGAQTEYAYDDKTFRLVGLRTTRPGGRNGPDANLLRNATVVQDLNYTYDPVGNVTRMEDRALRTIIFAGQVVRPVGGYTYDAVYRLIEATGREHIAQCTYNPLRDNPRDYPFLGPGPAATDPNAFRSYTERYAYDGAGNITSLEHQAAGGAWTRRYDYEPGSNRLASTSLPGDSPTAPYSATYGHNAHGDIDHMWHLERLDWDLKDQLSASSRQRRNGGTPETTYYAYDAAGTRTRKVTDRAAAGAAPPSKRYERIYLGSFELHRTYGGQAIERETLHVRDDLERILLVETVTMDKGNALATPTVRYRWQVSNHLGSTSLEIDDTADLISYEEYHPYGTSSYQLSSSATEVSAKRYRYSGKERDEETGFSYHGARYYLPWLGRWTSPDPESPGVHPNAYIGLHGNPVCLVDEFGRQGTPPTLQEQLRERPPPPLAKDPVGGYTGGERNPGQPEQFKTRGKGDNGWEPTPRDPRLPPDNDLIIKPGSSVGYLSKEPTISAGPGPVQSEADRQAFEAEVQERRSNPDREVRAPMDPVRFLSQFGTAANMPGYQPGATGPVIYEPVPGPGSSPNVIAEPPPFEPALESIGRETGAKIPGYAARGGSDWQRPPDLNNVTEWGAGVGSRVDAQGAPVAGKPSMQWGGAREPNLAEYTFRNQLLLNDWYNQDWARTPAGSVPLREYSVEITQPTPVASSRVMVQPKWDLPTVPFPEKVQHFNPSPAGFGKPKEGRLLGIIKPPGE